MQTYPRGLKPVAMLALVSGLALGITQRWLIWRALADASPGRRYAALFSWHLGMLRAGYYPPTGRSLLPWIQALSAAGVLILLTIAAVLVRWAQRSEANVR